MSISTFSKLAVSIFALCLFSGSVTQAQTSAVKYPGEKAATEKSDFKDIRAVAVYVYHKDFRDLSADRVDFTLRDEAQIKDILHAFRRKPINGQDLGTLPTSYVYFTDSANHLTQAKVVLGWQYIMLGNEWDKLYPLTPSASQTLRRHLKVKEKL